MRFASGEEHIKEQAFSKTSVCGWKTADEVFKNSFATKQLKTTQSRNKRIVRYILGKIERKQFDHEIEFGSDTYSLEHVLPLNPESGWEQFSDSEIDSMVFRLGNMVLLSKSQDRDLGNASYEAKRDVYSQCGTQLTGKLAEDNETWDTERIENFQNWMARQAVSIWRIDALN